MLYVSRIPRVELKPQTLTLVSLKIRFDTFDTFDNN